ncbi:hypothetical protein SDC9_83835 [bioreactor metagenome]|uniref:Uncharacterized protein n=1 Tax=bioreactor metagenome TaxID=1076179 RepID=A0A644ZAB8_9ZZZZ
MVGLAADDAAQRDQRIVLAAIGKCLQRQRHFQRAGNGDVGDVFFLHAELEQLCAAGVEQCVGDAFVEAGLHDADGQAVAIERGVGAFVCALHGVQSLGMYPVISRS